MFSPIIFFKYVKHFSVFFSKILCSIIIINEFTDQYSYLVSILYKDNSNNNEQCATSVKWMNNYNKTWI